MPETSGLGGCGTLFTVECAAAHLDLERSGAYEAPHAAGREILYVRTALHVVRTDEGAGGLPDDRLYSAIEKANEDFLSSGIVLVPVEGVDRIDSDAFFYDIDTTQEINELRSTNVLDGALNIYFTEHLANENGPICGISSFSWNPVQGVVMMNACVPSAWNPSTFSHELGHYFDLLHTHETVYGQECADGSNCPVAGDRLCDTPADPRLNRCGLGGNEYCVDSYCEYTGEFADPCHGDPYAPSTINMMSYSRPLCRSEFTPQQRLKAQATLMNLRADHLMAPADLPTPDPRESGLPSVSLGAPMPNPSAEKVRFAVRFQRASPGRVRVYDAGGRVVADLADRVFGAGTHPLDWAPPPRLPGAVYFLSLESPDGRRSRMIVRRP